MKGLKEEQIYEFRVAAENKAGVGPASDPTAPVQVKEPVGENLSANIISFLLEKYGGSKNGVKRVFPHLFIEGVV